MEKNDCVIADISLAESGRKEMELAKYERPGRMSLRAKYGEEKPLLHGHDEFSWAQNRRDDFIIVQ